MLADLMIDRRPQGKPLEILVGDDPLLIIIRGTKAELCALAPPGKAQIIAGRHRISVDQFLPVGIGARCKPGLLSCRQRIGSLSRV